MNRIGVWKELFLLFVALWRVDRRRVRLDTKREVRRYQKMGSHFAWKILSVARMKSTV